MAFNLISISLLLFVTRAFAQPDYVYYLRKPRQDPLYSTDLVTWSVPEFYRTVAGDSTSPVAYMVNGRNNSVVVYDIYEPTWVEIDNPSAADPVDPVNFELLGYVKTTLVDSSNATAPSGLPSNFTPVPLDTLQINLGNPNEEMFWLVNITDGNGASTVSNVTAQKHIDDYSSFNLPLPYVAPLNLKIKGNNGQEVRMMFQEQPPMKAAYFENDGDVPVFKHQMYITVTYQAGYPSNQTYRRSPSPTAAKILESLD